MRVLFLAPQPFFQDRGTPIAVRLALEVIAGRSKDTIDLLTYHEGKDFPIPGVTNHRILMPLISGVSPGISVKKLLCDFVFFFHAIFLVVKASRTEQYRLVHAVEESVFIAWIIRKLWGIPYIYDMDSSLALQVCEKWWLCKPLNPLLQEFEKLAVKGSDAVVPVCDALEVIASKHGARDTQILRDISLLDMENATVSEIKIKEETGIDPAAKIVMYIGNLESYQGIDLLINAMEKVLSVTPSIHCVIIGGSNEHIAFYKELCRSKNIHANVHFLGPRPVERLSEYLNQADILASPRRQGNNTPMKIYSYLHSGIPIVATRLPTHTQVLTDDTSVLTAVDAADYANGILQLFQNPEFAAELGKNAHDLAEEKYTFSVFSRDLNSLYDRVCDRIFPEQMSTSGTSDSLEDERKPIQKSIAKT